MALAQRPQPTDQLGEGYSLKGHANAVLAIGLIARQGPAQTMGTVGLVDDQYQGFRRSSRRDGRGASACNRRGISSRLCFSASVTSNQDWRRAAASMRN